MAIKKNIEVVADTVDAVKNVETLSDTFDKLKKKASEVEEELKNTTDPDKIKFLKKQLEDLNKELGNTGKETKEAGEKGKKGVGLLSKSFNTLGTAIKAAGIGLVVSAIAALGAAFANNQRFMDAFNAVTETVSIVLNQVSSALFDVYDSVTKNSANFDALGKVLNGLMTVTIAPFQLAWYGIKLGIEEAQLAWEKSAFGGNDKGTIDELTASILETKKNIYNVGAAAIVAGKDVVTNFGESMTELGNIGSQVVDEVGKISVKNAYEVAKTNVAIRNTAQLAAAQQGLLVEKYDILAEKQRKIRDDEFATIEDRKKASLELKKVLSDQEKAMKTQANLQIDAAQAQFDKTGKIEDEVALTEALANKQGILAQIEGFTTEQKEQNNALLKEEIELNNTLSDTKKQLLLDQLDFEASQENDPIKKLEKEKEALELENEQILEDLERKRELYLEGTQSRVDAEQLYLTEKQRINNDIIANETESKEALAKIEEEKRQARLDTFDNLINIAGAETKVGKAFLIAKQLLQAKELAMEAAKTITFSTQAAARSTVAIAEGTAQTAKIGFPQNIPMLIGYAAQAAGIISAISSATKGAGGSVGSGSSATTTPTQSTPSFNLIGSTREGAIAESQANASNPPIKAYVLSNDVTTEQEYDRKIENTASIG